jgi:tetratricopeptide (TPR) repeat protein
LTVTRLRLVWIGSGLLTAALMAVAPRATAARAVPATVDAQIASASNAIYNLDRDEALSLARQATIMAPDQSRAYRALATILWLDILFQRGAVTVDNYLGGLTRASLTLPKPPADLDAEFKRALARAIELADADVKRHPRDVAAMHDLGAAYAIDASYMASVDGRVMAAFGPARRAFDLEEHVLARTPARVEAGTVVGTYRYSVACLGLTSRLVAYLAGFGGNKARGIALIEAASRAGDARAEAKTALVLIYSREGRHADAYRVLGELAAEYPRNRLFVLEQGAAAIRAGHAEDAEALLTRGLAAFERDPRAKMPGERALWLYKLGSARISLNHPEQARQVLEAGLQSDPVAWVRGRLTFELGRVADLEGKRPEALARYRTARAIALQTNDPIGAADAARCLAQPFAMPTR